MQTLYQFLLAQHQSRLTAVRCTPEVKSQLQSYFEEVVTENNLAALVAASVSSVKHPHHCGTSATLTRFERLAVAADDAYFFIGAHDEDNLIIDKAAREEAFLLDETDTQAKRSPLVLRCGVEATEDFLIIASKSFSGLFAAHQLDAAQRRQSDLVDDAATTTTTTAADARSECIWSFEPDIVYSALEYLMSRTAAERPLHAKSFADAIQRHPPQAASLHLGLSVTTKFARLLHRQSARETALARITNAIRNLPDLSAILRTAVKELGRGLEVCDCAVRLDASERQDASSAYTSFYTRDADVSVNDNEFVKCDSNNETNACNKTNSSRDFMCQENHLTLERELSLLSKSFQSGVKRFLVHAAPLPTTWHTNQPPRNADNHRDKNNATAFEQQRLDTTTKATIAAATNNDDWWAVAAVPLIYQNRCYGALLVRDGSGARVWQESELRLLQSTANQLAAAASHTQLKIATQRFGVTDEVTGCLNPQAFAGQLERDIQLAGRSRQTLALMRIEVDYSATTTNDVDTSQITNKVLRAVAQGLRAELRSIDVAARFGDNSFAVILPHASAQGAQKAAERLRTRFAEQAVSEVDSNDLTDSLAVELTIGIATFPMHALAVESLINAAGEALCEARRAGGNRTRMIAVSDAPQHELFDLFSFEDAPAFVRLPVLTTIG